MPRRSEQRSLNPPRHGSKYLPYAGVSDPDAPYFAILAVRPTGLILVSPHTAGATSVFPLLLTPLHSGHTFWQRRGLPYLYGNPLYPPFTAPGKPVWREYAKTHSKTTIITPKWWFYQTARGFVLLPPCPPGAARASPKRTPKRIEKRGAKKEGQREAKGRPKDAKRGSKTRPGGSLGRVLGKIMQKSQVL